MQSSIKKNKPKYFSFGLNAYQSNQNVLNNDNNGIIQSGEKEAQGRHYCWT